MQNEKMGVLRLKCKDRAEQWIVPIELLRTYKHALSGMNRLTIPVRVSDESEQKATLVFIKQDGHLHCLDSLTNRRSDTYFMYETPFEVSYFLAGRLAAELKKNRQCRKVTVFDYSPEIRLYRL